MLLASESLAFDEDASDMVEAAFPAEISLHGLGYALGSEVRDPSLSLLPTGVTKLFGDGAPSPNVQTTTRRCDPHAG